MDREKLPELLEKVKAATGPDDFLDFEIDMAMKGHRNIGGWQALVVATGERVSVSNTASPNYTASIDAALALVERKLPGAMRRANDAEDGMGAKADLVLDGGEHVTGAGATWPLAILSALLTALSQEPSP